MSLKMVRKNLGWVRDTFYSNVSTECLLQRVSDRHGENSSLYSLIVDHPCGRLPAERADWSISVSLAAEWDRLTKPSVVGGEGGSNVCSLHHLPLPPLHFVCRAAMFSQHGKCPCSFAYNTRELMVLWCCRSLLCSFHPPCHLTIVHGRTAATGDGVHHTFSPCIITCSCKH